MKTTPAESTRIRLRRSVLYMPGSNARALDKARHLPADGLIFDLEHAVAPAAKALARQQVVRALTAGGYGARERVVRINELDSPWCDHDIEALAIAGADAILLSKVESAETVHQAVERLNGHGAPADLPLWAMIETPRGVLAVDRIAAAHERLACLVLGTSDLVKELRISHTRGRVGLLFALSRSVMAARANGLDILDGVSLDLTDEAGLRAACEQGRMLGFDGKTLIHPRQIEAANAAYVPDPADVARARRILETWDRAADPGVLVIDGRLIERLHVDEAERLLALQQAIDARAAG